jgi:hypothetical protein
MTYTIPNVLVTTDWVAGHAMDTGVLWRFGGLESCRRFQLH